MKTHTTRQRVLEALAPFARMPLKDARVLVRSDGQSLSVTGRDDKSQLTMAATAAPPCADGQCTVELARLRAAVESMRSDEIIIESACGGLTVRTNTTDAAAIPATGGMDTITIPDGADTAPLPTGFAGFLLLALQTAGGDDTRPVLQGVNVSPRGIAATDGRQLNSIPLPLPGLGRDVTLPPTPLYSALRRMRWTSISQWDESGVRHAAIRGDGFTLVVKAVAGIYPDYWKAFPDEPSLDISATIREDCRDRALAFLKAAPRRNDAKAEIWFLPDRIEFRDGDGRILELPASCGSGNLPCGVYCNAAFIHQALRLGHSTFRLGSRAIGPIVASGASGRFLFMPLSGRPVRRAASPATATMATRPATSSTPPTTTPDKKETKPMTQITTPASAAGAPRPLPPINMGAAAPAPRAETPQAQQANTQEQDPLAELTASIATMREGLDDLRARLLEAGRKIREAALQQKQKERVYLETARKLDCIRKAV